jgi:hypothetical protein
MTIYTPQDLIETMTSRIADGTYQADEPILVTIWCAKDASNWTDDGYDVTVEEWSRFLDDQRHGCLDYASERIEDESYQILQDKWLMYEIEQAVTDTQTNLKD